MTSTELIAGFNARIDAAVADPCVAHLIRPRERRGLVARAPAELAAEVERMAGVLLRGEPLDGRVVALWPLPAWLPQSPQRWPDVATADLPDVSTVREWARSRGLDTVAPDLTARVLGYTGPAGAYFTGIHGVPGAVDVDGQRWPAAGVWALCRVALDYSPGWAARRAARVVWGLLDERTEERTRPVFESAVRVAAGDAALTDREVATLAGRLRDVARADVLPLFDTLPRSDLEALATVDGALTWDRGLAGVLDRIGEIDKAATILERSAERAALGTGPALFEGGAAAIFALWTGEIDGVPRWLFALAAALWTHQWAPARERAARLKAPALPLVVRRDLEGIRNGRDLRPSSHGGFDWLTPDGRPVARFVSPSVDPERIATMRGGIERLHGVTFQRIIRGLTRRAYQQAIAGINPFNRLVYPGGFEGFAVAHGIAAGRERAGLEATFATLHGYRRGSSDIPPILTFWLRKASPSGRAQLRVDVGEALLPGYVSTLPAQARRLVPVLDVPFLDFADRGRHAALCDLQWDILIEQRIRCEEYAAHGGADVDVAALAAQREGLSRAWGDKARHAWTTGPDAWLRDDGRGRLSLVDPGADALIREAADYVRNARTRGIVKADKRRKG